MKPYILLFIAFLTITTLSSQNLEGTYANSWVSNSGEGIEYVLTIHEDGDFTFHHKRLYSNGTNDDVTTVKGTWALNGHLLTLDAHAKEDTNKTIASGLDESKAKFVSVSPRHPKFNIMEPRLQFYASALFYAKEMELIKTEQTVTITD